jgi:hypothetical protein
LWRHSLTEGPLDMAQVRETQNKFEERVWSIIRNCVRLGQENPALLVTAARIVQLQETVDIQLEASGTGDLMTCCLFRLIVLLPCHPLRALIIQLQEIVELQLEASGTGDHMSMSDHMGMSA